MTSNSQTTLTEPVDLREKPVSRGKGVRRRLLLWGIAAVLVALNGGWIWLDRQQPPAMRTIEGLVASGQIPKAEEALGDRLWLDRNDAEARMTLARLLGQREDYAGCARELHQITEWSPEKTEAIFLEAQSLKAANLSKELKVAWQRCITDDPLHPMPDRYYAGAARELIGQYVLESRFDKARETLWKVYDGAAPAERANILVMRMRLEVERIAHDDAVERLRRFAEASPDDWEVRRALALEEEITGDSEEADRHIQACLKARPDDSEIWSTWLQILEQRGNIEAIRQAMEKLPASASDMPESWKCRGLLLDRDGDLEAAAKAYGQAIKGRPYDPELRYKLGLVENRLGLTEQARETLKRSQDLRKAESEFQDAYFNYLNVSENSGRETAEHQAAVERMARVCEELGWKREARAWRDTLDTT